MMKQRTHGFTLIEVLIAFSLFAIVMVGISTAFSAAARIWKNGEKDLSIYQDARLALFLMATEISSLHYQTSFLMQGTEETLLFPTVAQGSGEIVLGRSSLLLVQYSLEGDELIRNEQVFTEGIPNPVKLSPADPAGVASSFLSEVELMETGEERVLAVSVKSLRFSYQWDGIVWDSSCLAGTGPPAVVQIDIEFEDPRPGQPPRAFQTRVSIPYRTGYGQSANLVTDYFNL